MLKAGHIAHTCSALVVLLTLTATAAQAASSAVADPVAAVMAPTERSTQLTLAAADPSINELAQSGAMPKTSPANAAAAGAELFAAHCAICHGPYGEGDGAVTPSLAVVLRDLRYLSARNNGEFPRDFVIDIVDGRAVRAAHGPEGMPVWGAEFARDEPMDEMAELQVEGRIEALADFLEAIQITERRRLRPDT